MRNTINVNLFSRTRTALLKAVTTGSLIIVTWCVVIVGVVAQERGFQPGASYALSDLEAINTKNGNMLLKIPLGGLPAGRGGVPGFQLNLVYNSKLYATHSETLPDEVTGQIVTQTWLNPSDLGGWRYDFNSYELELVSRENIEGQQPCACGLDYSKNAYNWKLRAIFPDGGEHEFRPLGYNDIHEDGYFNIDPNGEVTTASCVQEGGSGSCNIGTNQATTAGMTYYTTDGTFLRLFVPYSSTGNWGQNWTLSFPDGRRLVRTNNSRTMYDRNNNVLGTMEDSVGRQVTFQSNGDEDHIFVTGANNQQLEWIVKWKYVYVAREYKAFPVNQSRERGNSSTQVLTNEARVVDRITLPAQAGGLTYIFGYSASDTELESGFSSGWGELNSITLPTGARVNYTWLFDEINRSSSAILQLTPEVDWVLKNRPVRKELTYLQQYDVSSTEVTEVWTYGTPAAFTATSVRAPDGRVTSNSYFASSSNSLFSDLVSRTTHADGSITENVWAENRPQGVPQLSRAVNPYVQTELTSIKGSNDQFVKTKITDYKYDKNGNVTRIDEYDWIDAGSVERDSLDQPKPLSQWQWQGYSAFLKKTTVNTYYNPTPDAADTTTSSGNVYYSASAPFLRTAIQDTEVSLGTQKFARSEFLYDHALTTGNLIQQKSWDSTKGAYSNPLTSNNSIVVSTQYNSYGSPILTTNARNVQTRFTYGPIAGISDLYPTQVDIAYGAPLERTETRQYDFNTGLVTTITDVDNEVSTVTSHDDLGRPVLVRAAANRPGVETQTFTQYFDSQRRVVVRSDLHATGDRKLATIQHYDQLGRIRLTRSLENVSDEEDLANEAVGIKVQTRYQISNPCQPTNTPACFAANQSVLGSYVLTSNPYRAATSDAASESTMGWSRARTDYAGRTIEVQNFAGSALPAPWANNTASTGSITTVYDGIYTTVTDQAGKVRRSKLDGLGRLIRVDEPSDAANTLGSNDAPTQATSYQYDVLNNLIQVTQGNQTPRTFSYSSLGRLTSASNPESGVFNYEYHEDGNLKKKIDPRLVPNTEDKRTITYDYDVLGRVTTRVYNDGTPNVSYSYDAGTFGKGRLTEVSSSVSSYSYEYDPLGRIKATTQTTDGQAYTMTYEFNRAGALTSQSYPSGKVVKSEYDDAGRLAGVKNHATGSYYAGAASIDQSNRLQYSAHGAIQAMKLGNGLWEHASFNSRLQLTQIGLGSTSTNSSVLQLDYDYGTAANNGNLLTQTITIPGLTLTQIYTYDELNRLLTARENNGDSWKQKFLYDRFGNRRIVDDLNETTPELVGPNPFFAEANNRIVPQSGEQYEYDNAGNLTRDRDGQTYAFNAESKMVRVNGGPSLGGAEYFYDGEGQRVKKIVGTVTTIFVYDVSGNLIAEYSSETTESTGTSYLTSDNLGSPRVITDSGGLVLARHDYHPFGEEIVLKGGRGTPNGYVADTVRQKFTSKERDVETGLDYFLARYHSSIQGRFISPDPLLSSGRLPQPQSWNRYSYVINRPLKLVDPTGLDWGVTQWTEDGVVRTNYHWFDGKVGSHGGRDYRPVAFGSSGHLDVSADDGSIVRISNTGVIRQVIYGGPSRTGTGGDGGETLSIGAGLANSAARLIASTIAPSGEIRGVPVGLMAEHSFESVAGVDPYSSAYQNGRLIGDGLIFAATAALPIGKSIRINSPEYILWTKMLAFNEFEATLLAGGGKVIAGAGTNQKLRDAARLAAQHGGDAADWAKTSSRAFKAADGSVISAHAYKNVKNGKVVEVKGIIDKYAKAQ